MAFCATGHLLSALVTLTYNLNIRQGETFRREITWSIGGVPVNLTGYEGRMQIRPSTSSLVVWHELTTENGGIEFNDPATDGVIKLYIPADKTLLVPENGVYDLKLFTSVTESRTPLAGVVILNRAVTRDEPEEEPEP